MEYPDAIPESVVIKDTFGSSYKQSQEKFTPSPSPSPSSIEVMPMTSLVTFTSAPAILGGKKNCSALSAALTYGRHRRSS